MPEDKTISLDEFEALDSEAMDAGASNTYSLDEFDRMASWEEPTRGLSMIFQSAVKGFASDAARIPGQIGSLLKEAGEKGGAGLAAPGFADGLAIVNQLKGKKFVESPIDPILIRVGDKLNAKNEEMVQKFDLAPEPGSKASKWAFDIGAGFSSALSSLALLYATRSPSVPAIVFGARQKAEIYEEARQANRGPGEAAAISSAAGLVEGGVESFGGMALLKRLPMNKWFTRAVVHAGVEGLEEMTQQTGEEIITQTTGIRRDSLMNTILRIGYSGAIGFIVGAPAGIVTSSLQKTGIKKELRDIGLTSKQADAVIEKVTEKTMQDPGVKAELEKHIDEEIKETEKALSEAFIDKETQEPKAKKAKKAPKIRISAIDKFEQLLAKIEDKKERADLAKETKKDIVHILDIVDKRVKIPKKGEPEFEEGQEVPVRFRNKKGSALDEVRDQLSGVGVFLESTSDVVAYLNKLEQQLENLDAIIEEGKVVTVKKKQTTDLKQRIRDVRQGIREGTIATKEEIKKIQSDLADLITSSELDPEDKAKFIKTIKNIQTAQQLQKALPDIINRIERLQESAEKDRIAAKIKKEMKGTTPVKSGQKTVGRYDYESNKFFETYRGYFKLNKAQALSELELQPDTDLESDLMKKRLLSLRANGKTASAELYRQVLADIKRAKQIGEQAKTEEEFDKALERSLNVNEALKAIGNIKADKKTIKTKIGNMYRRGFSNLYSMFNSIAGKKFAQQYDQELNENDRDTAVYFQTKAVSRSAEKIYEAKDMAQVLAELETTKYKLTDFDALTTEVSKLDLIDIYNSMKNEQVKKRYQDAFGEAQLENLMNELTTKDVALADLLQDTVQQYRDILNKRHIEITGRDLGFVENYWPATSEHQANVFDDLRVQGETPSALKERAKGKVIPIPSNAWFKAGKHIAQAEHVDKLSREYETLKRLFSNRTVKHAVEQKFGEDVYRVLLDQIENISLNKQVARIDAVSGAFRAAINNWVTAKVALNPSTFVRQLGSVGNYMENMSSVEWTKLFLEGITSPKKTFDYMWNNNKFLEARFHRGYSEALKDAVSGAEQIGPKWGSWQRFLSSFARVGDVAAIIYGGYPLMKTKGSRVFEASTLKAQQSGLATSLSEFQNSRNPFARLFLAFKNTSNQYFRKMADAIISYQNGDISFGQFSKVMSIYAVIQPTVYATSGIVVKQAVKALGGNADDPEEIAEAIADDVMVQMMVSPVNAVPVLSDAARFAGEKLIGKKAWKVFSTPFLDDLENAIRQLAKKDPTAGDYFEAIGSILEPITAAPVKTGMRLFKYAAGENGKKKKGFKL